MRAYPSRLLRRIFISAIALLPPFVTVACGARSGLFAPVLDADDATAKRDAVGFDAQSFDGQPKADVASPPTSGVCTVPDGGLAQTGTACERRVLVLEQRRSSGTCFVDAVIKEGSRGVLRFDCQGGAAEAVFGERTFRGSYDGERFDTCTGTSFDWADGCRWNSAQRIHGELSSGELRFDYVETPAPGEKRCFTPCTATAQLIFE